MDYGMCLDIPSHDIDEDQTLVDKHGITTIEES